MSHFHTIITEVGPKLHRPSIKTSQHTTLTCPREQNSFYLEDPAFGGGGAVLLPKPSVAIACEGFGPYGFRAIAVGGGDNFESVPELVSPKILFLAS